MTLTITGPIPSKKNSKRIFKGVNGKPFITSQKGYKEWEYITALELASQAKQCLLSKPISYPVSINVAFGYGDNRKRDMDNSLTSILDTLVFAGILKDDSWQIVEKISCAACYRGEFKTIIDINGVF